MGLISDVLKTVKDQVRGVVPDKSPVVSQEPVVVPQTKNVLPKAKEKPVGLVSSVLSGSKQNPISFGTPKIIDAPLKPKSSMKFTVGEGLSPEQKNTAQSVIRKQDPAGYGKSITAQGYGMSKPALTSIGESYGTAFLSNGSPEEKAQALDELASTTFNVASVGPGEVNGLASKLSKSAINIFAKETDESVIKKILVDHYKLPQQTADELAPKLAGTKSSNEVKQVLSDFKPTAPVGAEVQQPSLLGSGATPASKSTGLVSKALMQKEPNPPSTYTVGGKTFNTIKEAVNHQTTLDNQNKKFMFDPSKRVDTTIHGNTSPAPVKDIQEIIRKKYPKVDVSISEKPTEISLSKIVVPKEMRGTGTGSSAMKDMIKYADETNKRIVLTPSKDFGASSVSRLTDFYKRFGFVENKGRAKDFSTRETMIREPKPQTFADKGTRTQEIRAQEDTAKIQKATKKLEDQAMPLPSASPKRVLPLKQTPQEPASVKTPPPVETPPAVPEPQEDISASDSYTDTIPQTEELSKEYADMLKSEDESVAKRAKEIIETGKSKEEIKNELDQLKLETSFSKEALDMHPGKELAKYANKRTGELPEVLGNTKGGAITGKTSKVTSKFGKMGDQIAMDLGFENSEDAREAFQEYAARRKVFLEQKHYIQSRVKDFREKKQIIEAVEADIRREGRERAKMVAAIQDFFKLTDKEMHDLSRGAPDFRTMSEKNFQGYLKGMENKAYEAMRHTEAVMEVNNTIFEKELSKVDNLRQAMKLPELENMTLKQLEDFNALLETYQKGDEFLGVRQLQTVRFTDLADIKTKREALEDLAKRAGVPLSDLQAVKVVEWDKYYYDAKLARQNPFYGVLVKDFDLATVNANLRYHAIKTKTDELMRKARASRPRRLVDKLVPTDQLIFKYLESSAEEKLHVAKSMTSDELNAALYIQDEFAKARDYLVKNEQLSRYRENYVTHVRRPFMEAWLKNDYQNQMRAMGKDIPEKNKINILRGFKEAFKEMVDVYKQDETIFNIMNQKTGEVLPLEKFFQFSLKRSDKLIPSQNVAHAFLTYMQTFQKKVGLDSIIPKLDIYTHALTPSKMTPRGLEFDATLKTFVKTWLNSKKGRVADTILVKPGGKLDWMLRSGVALTRLLDLGLNIPVGLASNIGEQTFSYINLGSKKYLSGLVRRRTAQGKAIVKKYESYVGEPFLTKMRDSSKNVGDKITEGLFGLFAAADRNANAVHLLGNLTPEEFKSGVISPERLSEMRLSQGRYRMVTGDTSIIGKTSIGQVFKQYKSWAIPAMHTTQDNIKLMLKMLKEKKNPMGTREFHELKREIILASFMLFAGYGVYSDLRDKKDKSFLETLAYKAMNDGLSMLGALDPSIWTATPRLMQWFADLGKSVSQVGVSLATGDRTDEGEVKGLKTLENTVTPKAVKQIIPPKNSDPLHQILKERDSEATQIQDEAEKEWASLKKTAETDKEKAAADFDLLIQNSPELAKKVLAIYKDEQLGLTDTDRLIKRLGVENGDRARYIYGEAMKLDTKEEKAAYLDELITKKVVTKKVVEQIAEMVKAKEPTFEEGGVVTKTGLIHTISTYAKAIGVDPVEAFKDIFTGKKIRYIANDAIITERLPLSESEKIKKERGNANTTGYRLDHTIPKELGGNDNEDNLQLVPEDVWKSYTPVENYLGKELRAGRMSKKEVQSLITRFKAGELQASDIIK